MKHLFSFSCLLLLFNLTGFSQDLPSVELKSNLKFGVPMEEYPTIDFSKKSPNISLNKPFDKSDLVQAPFYYFKDPSKMGLKFKRNVKPPMDFKMKVQPLPIMTTRMPIKELDNSQNPSILVKPLH